MICMEEDGMKKVLFEIVVPAVVLALWMITCYPVCCKAEGLFPLLDTGGMPLRYPENVSVSDTKELWNCRKHGCICT